MIQVHSILAVLICCTIGLASANNGQPTEPRLESIVWRSANGDTAQRIFEQIKTLAGTWESRSTKGWTGKLKIRVISRGSAVLWTSRFVDEPDEGMATVFHMDGDGLVLTHYCEAGNQPRLRLAEHDAEGSTLHFVFEGGGNLPTRDPGHMDESIMHLISDEVMSSRWTWHSKGVSTWMEDISYKRVAGLGTE